MLVGFAGTTTPNTAIFFGNYGGTYGTIRGGLATDVVTFGATGVDMTFVALLNDDDDTFNLDNTASLLSLIVDFGNGNDTFNDSLGMPYPFPVNLINLP